MKIGKKDKRLLKEAYRRWYMFNQSKGVPLEKAWLGLGFPTEYTKSSFFRPVDTLIPRGLNWWVLSSEGVEVMKKIIELNPWNGKFTFDGTVLDIQFPSL